MSHSKNGETSDTPEARLARSSTVEICLGLVAVLRAPGIPSAGIYTFYRDRKRRAEERIAVTGTRPKHAQSRQSFRRSRVQAARESYLPQEGVGWIVSFSMIARFGHDTRTVAMYP